MIHENVSTVEDSLLQATAETVKSLFVDVDGNIKSNVIVLDDKTISVNIDDKFFEYLLKGLFDDNAYVKFAGALTSNTKDSSLVFYIIQVKEDITAEVIVCNRPATVWLNLNPSRTDTWMGFVNLDGK
jgi:hypothetical protein